MGLTATWTLQKKKISELEERTTETIHLRHGDGERCKRMNRKSVNCGIISSGLSFMRLESKERRKEKMWKKNPFNFPPQI